MCRICGRMVKCIFESMPSRAPAMQKRAFSSVQSAACISAKPKPKFALRKTLRVGNVSSCAALPTFLLPMRSRLHTSTSQSTTATLPPQFQNTHVEVPPATTDTMGLSTAGTVADELVMPGQDDSQPPVLSKSLLTLLPILRAQKPHYITAHLHRFPYLLTEGDTLRLPFHMHGVAPGDTLRLNRASILGSRDYTLKAGTTRTESYDGNRTGMPQYIDERLYECRARVMGMESTPMMIKEKTKRRNRKVKKVHSKHRYTVLKLVELRIKSLEELQAEEGDKLILEAEA